MTKVDSYKQYLVGDDRESRSARAQRLKEVIGSARPSLNGNMFHGGISTVTAWTESRLAYVNGMYMATIFLVFAAVEHYLTGLLSVAGENDLNNRSTKRLLEDAKRLLLISDEDWQLFDELRELRNSYIHHRPLTDASSLTRRAMSTDTPVDKIMQSDARFALTVLRNLTARSSVPSFE